jgi:hypothetical protein
MTRLYYLTGRRRIQAQWVRGSFNTCQFLMLMTGARPNVEAEIVKSPLVRHAVMFGQARNQTGVLIELEESANHRYHIKEERAKLVEEIW